MSMFSRFPAARWLAPAAAVVILIGGSAAVQGLRNSAASASALPDRSAAQLIADVGQAKIDGLSGTVVQTSNLGLPELPGFGGGGTASFTSLLSGTHTLRVWYSGPSQARLSVLGTLGESDVILNGRDLWTWSSNDNTATHRLLGADPAKAGASGGVLGSSGAPSSSSALGSSGVLSSGGALSATPQAVAGLALQALNPTTTVTTSANSVVAGRAAYELVLAPKDKLSLVDQVRIAIDGAEHVPLRVQVFARDVTAPAFEIGFSAVDFDRPEAAQFTFNPPPGAIVTDESDQSGTASGRGTTGTARPSTGPGAGGASGCAAAPNQSAERTAEPTLVGSGWTAVVVASLPKSPVPAKGAAGPAPGCNPAIDLGSVTSILGILPTVSGSWGSGHLLAGTLFSVVITSDNRIAVGAVAPDALYAALGTK